MTKLQESLTRRFEPLGKHHDRAAFACPHPELVNYIQRYASQDAKRSISATTVLLVGSSNQAVAYHTLSATRLDLGELPPALARRYPKYAEGIPATLLGRLAVTTQLERKGHGRATLMNALQATYNATQSVASAFIIVRAIDDNAVRFYEKFEFVPLPDDPRRLFLPMETVRTLIEGD